MTYKRVLLKISGEALMGERNYGQDIKILEKICKDIQQVHEKNIEICLVVGGGNIFRGVAAAMDGVERSTADQMGMLATVMNALALQNCLEKLNIQTRVMSAISMTAICETYIRRRAIRHMEKGRIVIFASGIGNPFFTTDSAAALRATEMNCDIIFKGTQVDGVYSSDPKKEPNATRFDSLSYKDVISKDLNVMDTSAIAIARENNMPIVIFSIHEDNAFLKAIEGTGKHTIIK